MEDVVYPWDNVRTNDSITIVPSSSSQSSSDSANDVIVDTGNDVNQVEVRSDDPKSQSLSQSHQHGEGVESQPTRTVCVTVKVTEIHRLFHIRTEAYLLLSIAVPTVVSQFCGFFIFPLTAASLSRYLPPSDGREALAAFSLASLSANASVTSLTIGILTASDTLQPRAFGLGDYRSVGITAVRSLVVCAVVLLLPVLLLLTRLDVLLENVGGQDADASGMACRWVRWYCLGVPSVVLFRVLQRFLACQGVVVPCMYGAAIGCLIVHPVLLKCLLPALGFDGSALAIAITQSVQTIAAIGFTLGLKGSYVPETWPICHWTTLRSAVLDTESLFEYVRLSLGGVLSLSEWWFWETICFIAGKMGIVPLCVHTIAYQIVPVLFMIPLAIGIGLGVRIGALLPIDVPRAKRLTACAVLGTAGLGAIVASAMHRYREPVVALFTADEAIVAGCEAIWTDVCIYIFFLFLFAINSCILRALGMQWYSAAVIVVVMWCGTLPVLVHACLGERGGGLVAMWRILPVGYAVLDVGLALCYVCADWTIISEGICERARTPMVFSAEDGDGMMTGIISNDRTYLLEGDSVQKERI